MTDNQNIALDQKKEKNNTAKPGYAIGAYMRTGTGFMYLCYIIDLHTRYVINWLWSHRRWKHKSRPRPEVFRSLLQKGFHYSAFIAA